MSEAPAKKVKTKPQSGIVYTSAGESSPKDFITWHDQLPYRYWLHSRLVEEERGASSYRILSFESQWISNNGQAEPDKMVAVRFMRSPTRNEPKAGHMLCG